MIDAVNVEKIIDPDLNFYSDIYNAEFFANMYVDKIAYSMGTWYVYNGKFWERDERCNIKRYAIDAYKKIAEELREKARGKSDHDSGPIWTHLKKSSNNGALNSMLECAKPYLAVDAELFDQEGEVINCKNGTIFLNNRKFIDFESLMRITRQANVVYDKDAKCERWLSFLDEIFLGEADVIEYIQRIVGYSMTSSTKEHCMFILWGHGRNGKSKFLETITNIMGNYALNCPSTTFVEQRNQNIRNDIARLKGARIATTFESKQNVNLDEEMIKQLTAGDKITARFLNKEFFEFTPTFKIFLVTNHKPNIRGMDDGIWSRIHMIPFELTLKEEEQDKELGEKLAAESSGIFNWMIEGYERYKKVGIKIPDKIRRSNKLYREEEDDLGQFIEQECVEQIGGFISVSDFRERFKNVMGYYKGNKTISEYMARAGHKKPGDDARVFHAGKQQRGYVNLRWKTEMDSASENQGWQE